MPLLQRRTMEIIRIRSSTATDSILRKKTHTTRVNDSKRQRDTTSSSIKLPAKTPPQQDLAVALLLPLSPHCVALLSLEV